MVTNNVAKILKEKGKSRYWLRLKMNISHSNLNKIYFNEATQIRYDTLGKLIKCLECDFNTLLEIKKIKSKKK